MTDSETCECRTFAIGRCAQCQAPVCLHHSRLLDGICLCLAHYHQANDAAARRAPVEPAPHGPDSAAPENRRRWGRRR